MNSLNQTLDKLYQRKGLFWSIVAALIAICLLLGYGIFLNNRVESNITKADLLPTEATTTTPGTLKSSTTSPTPTPAISTVKPIPSKPITPTSKTSVVTKPTKTVNNVPADNPYVLPPNVKPLTEDQDENTNPIFVKAPEGNPSQPTGRTASQGDSMNFLIVGSDTRGGERGRSDVIIVAHLSSDRKRIDLVHFPRDYYVNIPGRGYEKINAAYSVGGAPLLIKTIQPLIKVPIDHVMIVDFNSFTQAVEAVGGVDVTVPPNTGGGGYTAGQTYHLNGAQALAFVRDRKHVNQGDIGRGQRQEAVLKAILSKGLSPQIIANPVAFTKFIDAGTKNVTVDRNFDMSFMRSLAWSMKDVSSSNIHSWTAPWLRAGTAANGRSVVFVAKTQLTKLAHAFLTDSFVNYSDNVSPTRGFSR